MTLIEHIHAKHLRDGRHEPTCILCVEAAEKQPSWVRRLRLNAKELGTRGGVA